MSDLKRNFEAIYGSRSESMDKNNRSENKILESLIGKTSYISRELFTFFPPDSFEQINVNSNLDPRIVDYCLARQGQVITDSQQSYIDPKNIHRYATTGECGRVIEVPTQQIATLLGKDGLGANLTMKGVGSTWYAREHGYQSPYIPDKHREITTLEEQRALSVISYYKGSGVLQLKDGLKEFGTSLKLIAEGVENVQTPVSLIKLKSIYSERGELLPLDYYKKINTLSESEVPVIFSRITDTNLRLMDLDVLNTLGYTESIKKILMLMTREYGKKNFPDRQSFSEAEYIIELTRKIIKNEMKITMLGYTLMATHWQDMIRNISLMGDRLDCEGVMFEGVFGSSDVEYGVDNIIDSICSMYSIFKKFCPELKLSDYLYTIIDTLIEEYNDGLEYVPKLRSETNHYYINFLFQTDSKFGIFRKRMRDFLNINPALFSSSDENETFKKELIDIMKGKLAFNDEMIEYSTKNSFSLSLRLDRDVYI